MRCRRTGHGKGLPGAGSHRCSPNRAYAQQAGFQPYPGLRTREVAPDIEDEWLAFYDRVSSSGMSETKESFNDGLKRWYRTQCSRIGPEGSPLLGFVFEDITERKAAEQEIVRSNQLLQATFDSSLQILQLFEAVRDANGAIGDFDWLLTDKQWNDRW
ncbi:hypothetical protein CS379_07015, partial [Methylobacterium frigidaeris]